MKAVVCTGYGKVDKVVRHSNQPMPEIRAHEVLVEVHAASVNPIDIKLAQGVMRAVRKLSFPYVMGLDVSGVVVAAGVHVKGFQRGDLVFSRVGNDGPGSFAEFVAVDAQFLAKKPARLSHQEAAALPLAALTAWQALHDVAHLRRGQKLLVHAGAGGVGSVAIQLAKQMGAHVTATAGTANQALLTTLGADVALDYTQPSFDAALQGFDVVLEALGGASTARSIQALNKGGVVVSVVGIPSPQWARAQGLPFYMPWLFALLNAKPNRQARARGGRYASMLMQPDGAALAHIAALVDQGAISPLIDRVYPLAQTPEALVYSQTGRAKGKIVIAVK